MIVELRSKAFWGGVLTAADTAYVHKRYLNPLKPSADDQVGTGSRSPRVARRTRGGTCAASARTGAHRRSLFYEQVGKRVHVGAQLSNCAAERMRCFAVLRQGYVGATDLVR